MRVRPQICSALGLEGQRLAVSLGSEESLARQLADWMGVPHRHWHAGFVTGQVKAAVTMEDLESRVAGDRATSSVPGIHDVQEVESKRKAQSIEPGVGPQEARRKPKRGLLGKSVRLRSGHVVMEDDVAGKIVGKLVRELEVYNAPVLEEVSKAINPDRATGALMGKYRTSTVRRYLGYWQKFRIWAERTSKPGQRPTAMQSFGC